jgi:hypothetical protein
MEARMQTRNRIMEDVSQLMTNAMGVAQGAKAEAETALNSMIDRWLADRDFVTREEFEARSRHGAEGPRGERGAEGADRGAGGQARRLTRGRG